MTKLNESQLPEVTLDRITAVETAVSRSDAYLISGGEVTWTGAGFIYRVGAAEYWLAGAKYTSVETQIELTQGNAVFDRIDLIVFSEQGTVLVIQGEASPTPFEPSYDASEFLKRSAVLVKAGRTFPEIVRSIIYAEGAANEWAVTATGEGFQLSDSSSPGAGNFAIAAVAVQTQNSLLFTADDALLVERWQELKLQIYPVAQWSTARRLRLTLRNSAGVRVGNSIAIRNGVFGFRSRIPSYQLLTIPLSAFGVVRGTLIKSLLLEVTGANSLPPISFFLDNVFVDTFTEEGLRVDQVGVSVFIDGESLGYFETINLVQGQNVNFLISQDLATKRLNLEIESIGGGTGSISEGFGGRVWTQVSGSFSAVVGRNYLVDTATVGGEGLLPPDPVFNDTIRFLTTSKNRNLTIRRNGKLWRGNAFDILVLNPFNLVELIYSGESLGWIPTNNGAQVDNGTLFTFQSPGDTHDVFFWLGTNRGAETWVNPHTLGRVNVRLYHTVASGFNTTGTPADAINRVASPGVIYRVGAAGQPAGVEFDFYGTIGNFILILSAFSFRTTTDSGTTHRNFTIYGHNGNYASRVPLRVLMGQNLNPESWNTYTIETNTGYRFIGWDNNGPNSNGDFFIRVSEFQVYGTLIQIP